MKVKYFYFFLTLIYSCSEKDNYNIIGNNVFFIDEYHSGSTWSIESFLLKKDKIQIIDADAATFKVFKYNNFAKDKNHCYYRGVKTNNSNPDFFQAISENYSKDLSSVFFKHIQLLDALPSTMRIFGTEDYAFDGKNVYVKSEKLNCNVETFNYLRNSIAKDCFKVFVKGNILNDVNPKKFTNIDNSDYYKNDEKIYWFSNRNEDLYEVDNVILKTFKQIKKSRYFCDSNYIFYEGKSIATVQENIVVLDDNTIILGKDTFISGYVK